MQNPHISIIGAGLGGLCLGQALKQAGIPFDIFERDPALNSRIQGYRIRIDANGQDALRTCLPTVLYDLFVQSCTVATSGGQFVDTQLRPIRGRAPETWSPAQAENEMEIAGDLSANRQTLREVLICGLEDHVHFGKHFSHFNTNTDETVQIFFDDGSSIVSSVLIGADGVNSHMRKQLMPEAEPTDTGAVCIYGRVTDQQMLQNLAHSTLWQGATVVFADGFAAIIDAMHFREPLPQLAKSLMPNCQLSAVDDYLYWALIGPRTRFGFQPDVDLPQNELQTLVATMTHDWDQGLHRLISYSEPSSLAALPIRTAQPDQFWPAGNATLLGDAIHVMSPAGGVGANTALRDASVLAEALCKVAGGQMVLSEALLSYQTEMVKRSGEAIRQSAAGASVLFSSSESLKAD